MHVHMRADSLSDYVQPGTARSPPVNAGKLSSSHELHTTAGVTLAAPPALSQVLERARHLEPHAAPAQFDV